MSLQSSYNFEGSENKNSITVASGESVVLNWSTTNEPTSCQASGDWSGSKSCSSKEEVVGPFIGPDTLVFRLEVENSAGSDVDSAEVVVGSPGEVHVRSDRKDDKSGNQFHVLYVAPSDVTPRGIDLDGSIANSLETGQRWLEDEAGGRSFRFDTYDGKLDITFFQLEKTNAEVDQGGGFGAIKEELVSAGFEEEDKKYLIFYDGTEDSDCGEAGGKYAFVYLRGSEGLTCSDNFPDSPQSPDELGGVVYIAVHELLHTLGAVDTDAPNHNEANPKHVEDEPSDIMYSSAGENPPRRPSKHLDYGRDDYFNLSDSLPEGVVNLANSPFFVK